MAKRSKKKIKAKSSIVKKAVNNVLTLLVLVLVFGMFVNILGKLSDDKVVAEIEAGDAINPPDETDWVSDRQIEFTNGILADILEADKQLAILKKMPSSSVGDKEKKRRAEEAFYDTRRATWAALTTPLDFERFAGRVEYMNKSRVVGGPNSGKTKVDIEIKLFGSGTILKDQLILDEQNNPVNTSNTSIWKITNANGSKADWFDISDGSSLSVSGAFIRYSEDRRWVHCCISSTGFPRFGVDFKSVVLLSE